MSKGNILYQIILKGLWGYIFFAIINPVYQVPTNLYIQLSPIFGNINFFLYAWPVDIVDWEGIEPSSSSMRVTCSTIELPAQVRSIISLKIYFSTCLTL